jgi:hypothetical protein
MLEGNETVCQKEMKKVSERYEKAGRPGGQERNENFIFINPLGNLEKVVQVSYLRVIIKVVGTSA